MKKYKRLILFVIMCLSFVLMFIYRHKYSKLSLLFELMNSFQFQDSEKKYNERLLEFKESLKADFHKNEHIAGVPYWTEMFPGIYIYASYWLSKMTRTLIFVEKLPTEDLKKIQCELSYENTDHPVESKTNIISIQKQPHGIFVYLECVPSFDTEVPYSLTFKHKNFTSTVILPYMQEQFYTGKYAMCLKPLPPAFRDVYKLLEFIIYHSHIGVKFFIFYEESLSSKAKKLLLDISVKEGIYILLLPWNVPFASRIAFDNTEVSFLDCFHRILARNQSNVILKMDLDNYIVPKNNWSLVHLINDFDLQTKVFKFHKKMFCSEYQNDIMAHNLNMPFVTLLKTKVLEEKNDPIQVGFDVFKSKKNILNSIEFQLWLYHKTVRKAKLISETDVVIHSYKTCGVQSEEKAAHDKSMWKYKDTFFKSHVYILAKKANLITD